jgi:branched-chain amino acid transport system permease protein
MSFMFSGIIAGFAGVLFALAYSSVSVETFEISQSIILFAIVIVGGQGSIVGVLLGTFIMFVVPELIRELAYFAERMGRSVNADTVSSLMKIRYLLFGFLMVILMIFRPNGLIPVKFGFYPKKFFRRGKA